jgi:hypothetical protein
MDDINRVVCTCTVGADATERLLPHVRTRRPPRTPVRSLATRLP